MKTGKKALLLALCAVLLVAATVMGTMAYLTSSVEVKNTFTVGNVTITMDEAKVDGNGKKIEGEGATRVTKNSYKLLPGHEYDKDPIIHVDSSSENCYLFVKVTNGISAIEATGDTTVVKQMEIKGWKVVDNVAGVYVYVGTAENASAPLAVKASDNITVFEKIVISGDVDGKTLENYEGKTIVVTAYAVQEDGFETKSAAEIWNATFGKSTT